MNPQIPVTARRVRSRLHLILLLASALVGSVVVLSAPAPSALAQSAPAAGEYMPLSPARILDTRAPGGGGAFAPNTSREIQVTGLGGVPSTDVLAVVLNVTVTNSVADGWGLVWQAGMPMPSSVSTINYVTGRSVNNMATSKVSAAGKVSYFSLNWTDLILDVVGYYRSSPGGAGYVPLTQGRILDTRTGGVKLAPGSTFDVKLRGVVGVPDVVGVNSVAFNMSTLNQDNRGHVSVYPRGHARPGTSSLNYAAERMQTQLVVATLSADGFASVYNAGGNVDMLIDVVGYYTAGSGARFVPITPTRVIDTRYNVPGWGTGPITQPLAPNTNTAIQLTGVAGVPTTGVSTVLINVIGGGSSSAGFLSFWASGDTQPGTIGLTYYPNENTSNAVMAKIGADGKMIVTNYAGSSVLVIDVVGYFSTEPGPSVPTGVIAAPGDSGATVAWGPPASNGGSAIGGYLVKVYKTTPTLSYVKETTTCATCTTTTVSGLTNGQGYRFDVFARNSFGYGSSATSNVVTAGGSPDLLTPTTVEVTRGDGQATVTWTRPSLRLEGLTSYVVKVFAEASPTTVVSTTTVTDPTSTAVVTGLTNGQSYFATVTASTLLVINVDSPRSAVFVPAGPPFAPTGVSATRDDKKASVTWLSPGDNGATVSGFEITTVNTETGAEVGVMAAAQSPADVGGFVNGTAYAFKVRAINAVGPGPYSSLSNTVTPAGVPLAPPNVQAVAGDGSPRSAGEQRTATGQRCGGTWSARPEWAHIT